ncbi:hypothetical protein B0J13DRAFT_679784 [Dactylonectria estremocensis]|uniref:PNPLA domain-containing protein n=1 Tax=Dactylonectria estremocensis TaxID=1079267 RepID=A0A9P9DWZ4_9HYPO|nr:hypothetical protein B0J13DRAFT_679784 [Dactylonectria estremocensis]
MPDNGIRLLALGGGGVRGLSSLLVLQSLMSAIDADSPPKPCEYFDMIGGTSTGGLIAIMLGRLQGLCMRLRAPPRQIKDLLS